MMHSVTWWVCCALLAFGAGCDSEAIEEIDAAVPDAAAPDASVPDLGPPPEVLYRIDFEDGTIKASVGTSNPELRSPNDTMPTGSITAVPNPFPDAHNSSKMVGLHEVPPGYHRAELSSQRLPTAGKTYTYTWSYLIPAGLDPAAATFVSLSQFKTYPCGKVNNPDAICRSGGIFDDVSLVPEGIRFDYRANPDCFSQLAPITRSEWQTFVMRVYWTTSNDGWLTLDQNGVRVLERTHIKTLFDGYDDATASDGGTKDCRMYWSVGLYAAGTQTLQLYTDEISITSP